jgi:hypothetical protein
MSTVARDMGAQPSLFRLWWTHGWFILLVYWCVQSSSGLTAPELTECRRRRLLPSFSAGAALLDDVSGSAFPLTCRPFLLLAAFTTNYRLLGPFATPLAPRIVGTELWETVRRRGLIGSTYGQLPPLFVVPTADRSVAQSSATSNRRLVWPDSDDHVRDHQPYLLHRRARLDRLRSAGRPRLAPLGARHQGRQRQAHIEASRPDRQPGWRGWQRTQGADGSNWLRERLTGASRQPSGSTPFPYFAPAAACFPSPPRSFVISATPSSSPSFTLISYGPIASSCVVGLSGRL